MKSTQEYLLHLITSTSAFASDFQDTSRTGSFYGSPHGDSYWALRETHFPKLHALPLSILSFPFFPPTIQSIQKYFLLYNLTITTLEQNCHLLSLNCHDSLLICLPTIISVSLLFICHTEARLFFIWIIFFPSKSHLLASSHTPNSLPKPQTASMICDTVSLLHFASSMDCVCCA